MFTNMSLTANLALARVMSCLYSASVNIRHCLITYAFYTSVNWI